jgi:hypothetical protein
MKESYGEGVATHTGPGSGVGHPRGGGEALTGVHAGGVSSREIIQYFRVPTLWDRWKAIPGVSRARDTIGPCAVGGLWHAWKHLVREPGEPLSAFERRGSEAASGSPKDVSR